MISRRFLTILADGFFLWVLFHYGLGGWESAREVVVYFGPLAWLLLGLVIFLLLYGSDYRSDLPLFLAGFVLGYWGEWWGTTRGVWQYWNGATPPDYLPPLWGLGLLTVYRLGGLAEQLLPEDLPAWTRVGMLASFIALPVLALANSGSTLLAVDWRGRLDAHFVAGLVVAVVLILYRFDLRKDFPVYICGMLLGGLYEYLGTSIAEWTYITGETPPLWIAPMWGLAAVAMTRLALLVRDGFQAADRVFRVESGLW